MIHVTVGGKRTSRNWTVFTVFTAALNNSWIILCVEDDYQNSVFLL